MSYPILYSKNEGVRTPAIAGIAVAGLTIVGDDTEQKTAFENQGLGTLSDAITCTVNEKRNGEYELEMQYPISGVHFSEIEQRSFILAKPNYTDDPQPFRVYKITKPLNGVCTIYARHISYDLSGFEMPAGRTASGLSATCALLTKYASPFKITTTRSASGEFKTDVPATVRSWLGGKQGSVLDLFGGEWHWDRYECQLATNRGTNRGVTIRYGKNLTELTQETSCDNLYTKIRPYYVDADNNVISGHLVSTGLNLDETRTLFLDCSEHFGTTVPTQAQLTSYAQTYAQANNLTVPDINITLDFVQLEGLAERVDLCDTVKVEYEALGVSATEKCIEVTWDVIRDRYSKAVFGSVKQNIADTVIKINEKAEEAVTPSVLEQSVERATSMITGNLGGYVVMHDSDGNGEPDEILIMNTPDINTATKVWRWNKNGLGYSSTGYDGDYGLAMTADGEIVADFITTGQLTSIAINNGNGTFAVDDAGHLIAMDADITGDITANSLTLGSGVTIPYSKISSKPDLSVYVQKDGTIGSTPAEGATGFVVSSAGLLKAANAIIYGTLYSSVGKIGGFTLASNNLSANASTTQTATEADATTIQQMIMSGTTPTAAQIEQYDFDGDGVITAMDYIRARNLANGASGVVNGTIAINANDTWRTIVLRDSDGNLSSWIGLKGMYAPSVGGATMHATELEATDAKFGDLVNRTGRVQYLAEDDTGSTTNLIRRTLSNVGALTYTVVSTF